MPWYYSYTFFCRCLEKTFWRLSRVKRLETSRVVSLQLVCEINFQFILFPFSARSSSVPKVNVFIATKFQSSFCLIIFGHAQYYGFVICFAPIPNEWSSLYIFYSLMCFIIAVRCARNTQTYFAERLHKSMKVLCLYAASIMNVCSLHCCQAELSFEQIWWLWPRSPLRALWNLQGLGTDDDLLIRIIVSRCEIDTKQIKQRFLELYGKTLKSFVEVCLLTVLIQTLVFSKCSPKWIW